MLTASELRNDDVLEHKNKVITYVDRTWMYYYLHVIYNCLCSRVKNLNDWDVFLRELVDTPTILLGGVLGL